MNFHFAPKDKILIKMQMSDRVDFKLNVGSELQVGPGMYYYFTMSVVKKLGKTQLVLNLIPSIQ
jgi:hypothetical protein